eukprot:6175330-Pleurochrysis_carterae.AAC.1
MADAIDLMPGLERRGHHAPVARVLAAVLLQLVAAEVPGLSLDVTKKGTLALRPARAGAGGRVAILSSRGGDLAKENGAAEAVGGGLDLEAERLRLALDKVLEGDGGLRLLLVAAQ